MNVLLVDDQKAIVDSLKNGIRWDKLPVGQVYTACSAKEAKLVLMNFVVDVLVSDIEMPEEDGLSLCGWAKDKFPGIECIFLTSHAGLLKWEALTTFYSLSDMRKWRKPF